MIYKRTLLLLLSLVIVSNCAKSPLDSGGDGSWELIRQSQTQFLYQSIHFIDEKTGWAVGGSGIIIHTDDSGDSWHLRESGTSAFLQDVQFIDRNMGWVVGSDNTILATTDGGRNWVQHEIQTEMSKTFMSVYFIDKNTGWVADNYGGIFFTNDAGNSWRRQESHTNWAITAIQFVDKNRGWALTTNKVALHTEDAGKNWQPVPMPSESDDIPLVCNDLFLLDEDRGWIGGMFVGGTMQETVPLYHSMESGSGWETQTDIPIIWIAAIHFVDYNQGWIAGMDKLFHTMDGGESWEVQYQAPDEVFVDICFTDAGHGWALGSGGNIYRYAL